MTAKRSPSEVLEAVWLSATQRLSPAWAQRWLERPDVRRFAVFLVVGGLNTLFGYGVFCAMLALGVHYALAGLIATGAGVIFNFHTTGRLVFDTTDPRRLARFIALYALMYAVGTAEMRVAELASWNLYLASGILLLPNALLTYVLGKLFVFNPST